MSPKRLQQRSVCRDCGNRYQGTPLYLQVLERHNRYPVWLFISVQLCPVCKVARQDWLGSAS